MGEIHALALIHATFAGMERRVVFGEFKATLKPHQCDFKATPKGVDSLAIGTPKPP
jgi:hypothetical protein